MRRVKVEITSDNPEDKGPAVFTVEVDRGSGTTEVDRKVVIAENLPKGIVFQMNENERLIVEPFAKEAIAYSPVQYAAYVVAEQEKLGQIDSPAGVAPTEEEKEVKELERKRTEKETGIKAAPFPDEKLPAPAAAAAAAKEQKPPIDSNQVAGREPKDDKKK